MALVQIYKNPNNMQSILDKFYTAAEPEVPEGEAALLDQLGGAPQAPQGPAPDIRSLLLGGVQGA
jgi:hypothetical protein